MSCWPVPFKDVPQTKYCEYKNKEKDFVFRDGYCRSICANTIVSPSTGRPETMIASLNANTAITIDSAWHDITNWTTATGNPPSSFFNKAPTVGSFNGTAYTVVTPGEYLITASAVTDQTQDVNVRLRIQITRGGQSISPVGILMFPWNGPAGVFNASRSFSLSTIQLLQAGDTIKIQGLIGAGGAAGNQFQANTLSTGDVTSTPNHFAVRLLF